jgi:hypothetical protein
MKTNTLNTSLVILLLFISTIISFAQTTYSHNGGYWEDPSSWSPSYPGTTINSADTVIIYGFIINNTQITINGELINNGYINNFGGIICEGSIINEAGSNGNGTITNYNGPNGGNLDITTNGTLVNNGYIDGDSTAYIFNNGVLLNNGIIDDSAITNYGLLENNGNITSIESTYNQISATLQGTNINHYGEPLYNYGTLSPGPLNGIGTYKIDGGYLNSNILKIELESTTSFDVVEVGPFDLGAHINNSTLDVSLLNGFTPNIGDTFTILTSINGIVGTFGTTNFPPGYVFNINYSPTAVILEVTDTLSTLDFNVSTIFLYPNPTSNILNIELNNTSELKKVTIYNNLGQLITEENKPKIDVSNYSKGIYFAEIITTKGKVTKKFIVE